MTNTTLALGVRYPYEEFADHLKAMKTVREWEDTSRFGHVGKAQNSRENTARVVEYFFDSYGDQKEAVHKAELFLSIHDYVARHAELFARKNLIEKQHDGLFTVDPALLRAVHHIYTGAAWPGSMDPRKVLTLARAFKEIEPSV